MTLNCQKPPGPTLAGFQEFITNVMQIPAISLPPSSPVIGFAYGVALDIVLRIIQKTSPFIYTIAVYNLAADLLINYAQDTPATPTYFTAMREQFKIGQFAAGVVSSAADEATSTSIDVVQGMKNLTIDQLNNLKTSYGRTYIGIAAKFGTSWGIN